jgi:hypothetical protein
MDMAMDRVGLSDLCTILRTKNAGPFLFTLDIVFAKTAVYEVVKARRLLTRERIAEAYGVLPESVTVFESFDNINAFKATIRRNRVSGSPGDSDVYAKNQEVPALTISFSRADLPM